MKYINKFIAVGLGFALVFTGTNFIHGMFTSKAVQKNVITIQKPNIVVDTNKKVYFYGKTTGGQKFDQLYIPVIINGIESEKLNITAKVQEIGNSTPITINDITIGKGVHGVNPSDLDTDCIIINSSKLDFGVHEKYNINVSVTIKGHNTPIFNEIYGVEKYNQGNGFEGTTGKRGQYVNLVEPYINNIENEGTVESGVVEPPKEEVEVPSEPEVVDPPKEEVEKPSEPEVVEPPKEEVEKPSEPEVVEPPKVEETVIPTQPDIIAPSKDETEI